VVYFGPQTKKLLTLIYLHPNGLFSGEYILSLRGCCALKLLHALQIDQALLAHTPRWDGVPPKNFNRENLKFGLKFRILRSITSGLVGVSSRDFFQSTSRVAGVITWVQFLQGPPQKICDGKKNRPKFGAIFDDFRLRSRISPERGNISEIGKALENLQPLPRWDEKKMLYNFWVQFLQGLH